MFQPNPTELGQLKSLWTDSYHGQKAYFINNNVFLYTCGTTIKFYNTETKEQTTFTPPDLNGEDEFNGISLLTACPASNKFAFSETQMSPKVRVYDYDRQIKEVSKLIDGATVEYLAIEFSNSEAILTLAGIPDYQIIVWDWKTGQRYETINLSSTLMSPEYVCFSPVNWRHITVAYKNEINIWNIELCDSKDTKTTKTRFIMPITDGNVEEQVVASEFKDEFKYPFKAIAGLDEDYGEVINEVLDKRERHQFKSLCWSNFDEIMFTTKENYIFRYSLANSSISCVFNPNEVQLKENDPFQLKGNFSIEKLYLHRKALFVVCSDGLIRLLDGAGILAMSKKNEREFIHVNHLIDTSSTLVSNISFNTKYSMAAISTNKGIELLDSKKLFNEHKQNDIVSMKLNARNEKESKEDRLSLSINYDYGNTVAISPLCAYSDSFLCLKDNGILQVWNIKEKKITNRVFLNEKCSYLTAHPGMPVVVVGTQKGSLIFIDFTDAKSPKILENCLIHKKAVKRLKFNSSGTVLFSVGEDNKIFLIDTRLSPKVQKILVNNDQRLVTNFPKNNSFEPGFHLLGYIEYEGEAVCIDVFDYMSDEADKSISSRVVVGIHDSQAWDAVKKTIVEVPVSASPVASTKDIEKNQNQAAANQAAAAAANMNHIHNILVHNIQTNAVIPRLQYVNSSSSANYDHANSQEHVKLCSKLIVFDFNFNMFSDLTRIYATRRLDLKDEIINKFILNSNYLFSDCVLTSRNYLLTLTDRFLTKFVIPENDHAKKGAKVAHLELNEIVGNHDFGYGCFSRSTNNQFVVSGGYDGSVTIRKTIDLKTFIETKGAHYINGGVQMVRFHNDNFNIILVGHDNTITTVNWKCNNPITDRLVRQANIEGDYELAHLSKMPANYKGPNADNSQTWFEIKEKEYFNEQDAHYLPIKKEIADGLVEIRQKLKELIKTNQSREDLAKLKEHEFYLDLEELERLQKESDAEILKIREKTEYENLGKLFVRENIKKECWDKMKVKGRGIQAFNSNLLVENYAIREREKEELKYLERVKSMRKIELAAQKTRSELTSEIMKRENIGELAEMDEDDSKDNDNAAKDGNQVSKYGDYLNPNLTQLAFKGSIGALFNGDSNLFYHQFELFTREQKWMQIALIQDAIFKIKENFNKEFEQIMARKNQEIAKIKEKNQRLKQIFIDLNEDKQLAEPEFGDAENPEVLFEVKDSEIKVEKYLTPEQRKQLEEQLAEEARRRELEKLDNWRERGLMDMMGGVLQVRREDELKKDIPVPSFVNEKPQEEWTPDEVKQYQIYEQKVKELNEERDKLKKQLNAEINKINEQIIEYYQNFDNQLFSLHQRKVKTQQSIYQEELKILRLFNSLVVEAELVTYEAQINDKLESVKEEKKILAQEIQHIKKAFEAFKEEFEILSAEDKSQEKAFIREFSDVSPASREQLLRLFKKRAKQRGTINKTNLNPAPQFMPELGEDNPFSDRPTTAQQINIYDMDTEMTLAELDNFDNAPGGVDKSVWDRFVHARRQKIELENTLRLKTLNLNEMAQFYQKRQEEEEIKRREIDEYSKTSIAIQELRLKASHNLQIQLLMKQGQVEIDPGAYVHNFENCLLINRNVVESLNKVIQHHGKQKIDIMVNSKDFRKGIRQLEWEHRKMKMTIEDYIQKQRDITYLKLTREVQEFLGTEDYDGKKQKEAAVLEQTLGYQAQAFQRVYNKKAKKLREIKNESIKVANNNDQLDDQLIDQNITLHQRKHVNQEMTGKSAETIREEKFQQIIQRRKLVDLAKAQAQEVAFLRSEVERLRMKTFPALVQIEF